MEKRINFWINLLAEVFPNSGFRIDTGSRSFRLIGHVDQTHVLAIKIQPLNEPEKCTIHVHDIRYPWDSAPIIDTYMIYDNQIPFIPRETEDHDLPQDYYYEFIKNLLKYYMYFINS